MERANIMSVYVTELVEVSYAIRSLRGISRLNSLEMTLGTSQQRARPFPTESMPPMGYVVPRAFIQLSISVLSTAFSNRILINSFLDRFVSFDISSSFFNVVSLMRTEITLLPSSPF